MRSREAVRSYFDREAARFDAIYEQGKPLGQRLVDGARRVVVERWKLICNLAPIRGEWMALDVGCGSGRYAIEFLRRGAARVVGIDLAPAMIEIARQHAAEAGVSERADFRVESFLEFQTADSFDVIVAAGYFDYLEDPVAHLRRMVALSRGHIYVTVPKRWEYRYRFAPRGLPSPADSSASTAGVSSCRSRAMPAFCPTACRFSIWDATGSP